MTLVSYIPTNVIRLVVPFMVILAFHVLTFLRFCDSNYNCIRFKPIDHINSKITPQETQAETSLRANFAG